MTERPEQVTHMAGFVSTRLQIRFEPGEGADNLRIFGPDEARFLTFAESVEKSKSDSQWATAAQRLGEQIRLATAERQRADEERQRADEERRRADRLAERLRKLGGETD